MCKYIDLSKIDFLTGKKTKRNTANCYVIRKPGKYKFPIVYGNSIKNGEINPNSYNGFKKYDNHFISEPQILNKNDFHYHNITVKTRDTEGGILIFDLKYNKKYIKFRVGLDDEFNGGNTILCLLRDGVLIWCWDIWYFKDPCIVNIGYQRKKKVSKKYNDKMSVLSAPIGYYDSNDGRYSVVRYRYYRNGIPLPKRTSIYSALNSFITPWTWTDSTKYIVTPLENKLISDPCPPGFMVPGKDVFIELIKKMNKHKDSLPVLDFSNYNKEVAFQVRDGNTVIRLYYNSEDNKLTYRLIFPNGLECYPIIPCVEGN